jgi:pantetheine-phosphate adenylyltransferase
VAHNTEKEPLFSVSERVELLKKAARGIKGVEIDDFHGLVVDYVRSKKLRVVIRGLRMISDFEYEFQMALTNRKLSKDVETIFMMPSEAYSYLSSKLIKEATGLGADLKGFVPGFVEKAIKAKLRYGTVATVPYSYHERKYRIFRKDLRTRQGCEKEDPVIRGV